MKIFHKLTLILLSLLILTLAIPEPKVNLTTIPCTNTEKPFKVGVLLGYTTAYLLSSFQEDLKKIESVNSSVVDFIFFDAQSNQNIQNEQLNSVLTENKVDLIVLHLVDPRNTKYAVDKIKSHNIPVAFIGYASIAEVNTYNKAYFVTTNPEQGGNMQGQILVDAWNKSRGMIDSNRDNIMQYILLLGDPSNVYSDLRTRSCLDAINNSNIHTQELASKVCYWREDLANDAVSNFFLQFGNRIEVIIANDDVMAIGAIKALQKYGYNAGNKMSNISVVGFDGVPEAIELIEKGDMTGTVVQDTAYVADNIFKITINMLNNRNPVEGTDCTIGPLGNIISIPNRGVIFSST
ncbi:galactose ABC transporter substrate-binding protein [Clostridium cellulovorans]|uniref:D-galactose/methyl-galactoside binding periplasmic protein MglB n=1 Tax=Clostridium cellulovorans (strain ATCC 35296 / DSM 3052 / OCM 3 / 743B) TaxID=573061 RepID=D9SU51_CLOC7|nr:galactose ABC transporter substrate-binding protein [Clostridium cellulovorans]ADL50889.1 putative galactoside ABC transporter [Clostridium cellulovorans 743B]